jgi:hypothetical protein
MKFRDQVEYIESTLTELGLSPDKFDLGRDDGHQFFEFHIGTSDETKMRLVEENYDLLVNKANTPLVMSMVPYICDNCENLHLCFYIKVLSVDNPFRTGELEHHLYYFSADEVTSIH